MAIIVEHADGKTTYAIGGHMFQKDGTLYVQESRTYGGSSDGPTLGLYAPGHWNRAYVVGHAEIEEYDPADGIA